MGVLLNKNIDKTIIDDKELDKEASFQQKDDIKRFIKYAVLISLVFVSITFSPFISVFVVLFCCVWAFFGPEKVIQAITLVSIIRFANPVLVSYTIDMSAVSWVLILIAAIKHVPWGCVNDLKRLLPILIFCFFAIFLSIVSSEALGISLLKIISFLVGTLAIISAYNRMTKEKIRSMLIWLLAIMTMVVIFSLLVLPNKYIAYNLNGVGFQGVLNHPQTLGALLAPFTAYVLGRFVFEQNKIISYKLFLVFLLITLILLTQARTAAVSVFLSIVVTAFFLSFTSIKAKIKSIDGFALKGIGGSLLIILTIILYQPAQNIFKEFVFKRESVSIDEALSSRAGGYSSQLDNFIKSPIIGHGFGVYPGPVPSTNIRYFMGVPISAAVEKGFLPTAVLEELGLIGMIVFIYLIVSLTRYVLKAKDAGIICLYFACLFINIGEAVFFAVGGMGIFYWSLIGLSTVMYKIEGKD